MMGPMRFGDSAVVRWCSALMLLCVLTACGASKPDLGGVHAKFGYSDDGLVVREVPEGGPAHEAGLEPGDRVMTIDGHDVSTLSEKRVIELLRGPVGSMASIEVRRGVKLRSVTVTRVAYAKRQSEDDE